MEIQPTNQAKKYKYVMFNYSSEPTLVEMLEGVSLLLLHVIVC